MSTTTGYEYKPKSNAGRIANFVDTRVGMSGVVKKVPEIRSTTKLYRATSPNIKDQ